MRKTKNVKRKRNNLPNHPSRLYVLRFTLSAFTLALTVAACGQGATSVLTKPEVGYPPPPLVLEDLAGQLVSLADLRGQVVLLNFWALWCDPCKAEMPDFQAALDRFGPQGFAVVAVDLGDQPKKVAAFIAEHDYHFVTLLDPALQVGQSYDTRILPLSFLIDRQGFIRYQRVTPFEPGQLTAEIEALINEEP